MQQIVLDIAPGGLVTSEVCGVKGPACTDIAKFMNEIGQVVGDVELKPEYYEEASEAHEQLKQE